MPCEITQCYLPPGRSNIPAFNTAKLNWYSIIATQYTSLQLASPLWELTRHVRSHSVTCHLAEVTFPPLPQPN